MPFNQHSDTLPLRGVRIQTKKYQLELLHIYFGRKMNRCLLSRDSFETLVVSCSLLRSQDFLTFVVWLIKLVLKALYDVSHLNVLQNYRESAATTVQAMLLLNTEEKQSNETNTNRILHWNNSLHWTANSASPQTLWVVAALNKECLQWLAVRKWK